MIVGCVSKNDRDRGVYFARIPSVVSNQGEEAEKLSRERQLRWISAISRADLTKHGSHTAVCGSHFVSGQAAKSWDKYNVDWVPTLNLGHERKQDTPNLEQAFQRGQRAIKKEGTRKEQQEREHVLAEEILAKT